MKLTLSLAAVALAGFNIFAADSPAHWKLAPTPPMGWNSYDAFGSSVTEEEFLANASYLKEKLLPLGYNYVVVDFRWADATAANYNPNGIGGPLEADQFGRLIPAPNRFPSAAGGAGFKPLADKVHAMGLKFGIHIMRGIPKQSVAANTPIEGSSFKAAEAADTKSTCGWCKDMWGVNATKPAGQAYYDSLFRLYASWGVDFVKIDDLSQPYHKAEVEALRKAIDKCGRPIVFSTSPGQTPVDQSAHVAAHANMWRVSGDFWDKWGSLNHAFDLAAKWAGVGGPGRWPDGDMIPFGKVGIRCVGKPRTSNFTRDEQVTLMSLWSLMPSPLMLGGNQPENDEWALSVISNREVLAINQDPLGKPARRLSQKNSAEIWVRDLADGSKAVGLFNRGEDVAAVTLSISEAGLSSQWKGRDLWAHKDLGNATPEITLNVPKHGSILLKFTK